MIINIGYFALLTAAGLTIYSVAANVVGIKRDDFNIILSAQYSLIAVFLMVSTAYLALTFAFVSDDFSARLVAEHSSSDLPLFYKITAVWGGSRGSLLLWELILSFYTAVVILRYKNEGKEILPYTLIILGCVSLFLLFLLIGWSNPLARLFPAPVEGSGLNPLLQNPGMVYHPPSLYLGYVGFTVPFAFAMGSLLRGRLDNRWILTTRRWSLFSWICLTAGMVFGGNWAYLELGWGGYWAWDPVENSSLIPWLTGTAFLHSVIVQEKRNTLKIWNMALITATFALSVLGTFITRSGILSSVHSFGKSAIGPAFLFFIVVILVFSHAIIILRRSLLESRPSDAGFFCKENSFLLNNIVFVIMAFTVLYGTLFPLLSEAVAGKKISIQAPFFNAILTPFAILTILLMGATHILAWRRNSLSSLGRNLLWPLLAAAASIIIALSLIAHDLPWGFYLMAGSVALAGCVIIQEFFRSFKVYPLLRGEKLKSLLKDRRRRGALMTHLGVILLMTGICGNFFNHETSFSFFPGEEKTVGAYTLKFIKAKEFKYQNSHRLGVETAVFKDKQQIDVLLPAKAYYPTSSQPMTEVAIHRSIKEDLYISFSELNKDGSATVKVYINPLVNLVWLSMLFFIAGIAWSMSYKPAQLKKIG